MFEKFNNTSSIQERFAQNSEYIKRCSAEFEFTFYNGNQTVCNDGSIDLYSNSILRSAPKGFDVKMLLDPFKEEFNLPPFFIEQSYLRGFYLKAVRQVYKGSMNSMFLFFSEKKAKYGCRLSLENFAEYKNIKVYPLYAVNNSLK